MTTALIVKNDCMLQRHWCALLEREGVKCLFASDTQTAKSVFAKNQNIDVIVLPFDNYPISELIQDFRSRGFKGAIISHMADNNVVDEVRHFLQKPNLFS